MGLANEQGLRSVEPQPAPGRKPRLDADVQAQLDWALQESPEKFGLERTRGDGVLVVEYLRRFHRIERKVRQAQRSVRRLGFTLHMPIGRYLQATGKGVEKFQRSVKKNSARRSDIATSAWCFFRMRAGIAGTPSWGGWGRSGASGRW